MYAQASHDEDEAVTDALDRLITCASKLVWATDAEGFFTFLNPQAAALCNLQGMHAWAWAGRIHPKDLANILPLVRDACSNKTEFMVEYRVMTSDGSLRWMASAGAPHLSAAGELLGYSGTTQDVSTKYAALASLEQRLGLLNLFSQCEAQSMLH